MSAAGTEILRAEGICKSYDGRAIIRDAVSYTHLTLPTNSLV